jgi:hypothetical protein
VGVSESVSENLGECLTALPEAFLCGSIERNGRQECDAEVRMERQPTEASRWRIAFAEELIQFYVPRDDIQMAVLSGSPPKGLSDEYSDLDIIVFWKKIDVEWLEQNPLSEIMCDRKYFRKMGEADIYLESQYFGELKADFGHLTMVVWEEMVGDVLERHKADPSSLGSIAGFMTSLPLFGDELVDEWKARLAPYPEELAVKIVRQNRRFFVPGYLLNQAYRRGDVLAYYDGLCVMIKNLLNILAGLNRMYFSTEEPRWIGYYLDRMAIKPEATWERIQRALASDGEEGAEILEGLMADVLGLIREHMPELDDGFEGRWRDMAVRGRPSKPEIRLRSAGGAPAAR